MSEKENNENIEDKFENNIKDNKLTILALVFDEDFETFKYNFEYNMVHDLPDELIVILSGTKFLNYDQLIDFERKYSILFENFKLIKFDRRKMDSFMFMEGLKYTSSDIISVIFGKNFYHKKRNEIIKHIYRKHDPKILIHSFIYEYCWRQNILINNLNLENNIYTEENNNKELIQDNSILTIYRNYKNISLDCSICNSPTYFSSDKGYNFCKICLSEIYIHNDYKTCIKCPISSNLEIKQLKNRNKIKFINDNNYHQYYIDPNHMNDCVYCNDKNQLYFKDINDEDLENLEFIDNEKLLNYNFNHDLIYPKKKVIFGKTKDKQIFPDTLSFTFKKELIDIFLFHLDTSLNINHSNNGFQNLLINYMLKENYKIILLNLKLSIVSVKKRYPENKHFKLLEKSNFNILTDDFYDGKNNRSWYEYLYIDKAIYEENNK